MSGRQLYAIRWEDQRWASWARQRPAVDRTRRTPSFRLFSSFPPLPPLATMATIARTSAPVAAARSISMRASVSGGGRGAAGRDRDSCYFFWLRAGRPERPVATAFPPPASSPSPPSRTTLPQCVVEGRDRGPEPRGRLVGTATPALTPPTGGRRDLPIPPSPSGSPRRRRFPPPDLLQVDLRGRHLRPARRPQGRPRGRRPLRRCARQGEKKNAGRQVVVGVAAPALARHATTAAHVCRLRHAQFLGERAGERGEAPRRAKARALGRLTRERPQNAR